MSNKSLNIQVTEQKGILTLNVNGIGQSAIDTNNLNNYVFEYMKYFFFPLILTKVKSALFIGGGGFTGPRLFASKNICVDAVELEQEIVNIAKEKFRINDKNITVIVKDGFEYLKECNKKYDAIILDVFVGNKTPSKFESSEFFELVKSHLKEEGVFLSNNISAPKKSHFQSLYISMSEHFRCIYAFDNDPESPQNRNILLVATNNKPLSIDQMLVRNFKSEIDFEYEIKNNLFVSDF